MTPRYKLRTLLILLAVLPPLLAVGWWRYQAWNAEQEKVEAFWLRGRLHIVVVPDGGSVLLGGLKAPTVRAAGEPPPRDSSDLEHGKGP
jgi:hypothetical protein